MTLSVRNEDSKAHLRGYSLREVDPDQRDRQEGFILKDGKKAVATSYTMTLNLSLFISL